MSAEAARPPSRIRFRRVTLSIEISLLLSTGHVLQQLPNGLPVLNVEVLHVQSIVFDELAPRFYIFAHQRGEDGLGLGNVFELDLKQGAPLWIHRGFPQLR